MLIIDYKDRRPLYVQIKDGIKNMIINNVLKEGEKLPSIRELSMELTVNPNTVMRAYRDLEAENYIYSVLGKGNFVSKKEQDVNKEKKEEIYKSLKNNILELKFLYEPKQNIINFVNNIYGGGI